MLSLPSLVARGFLRSRRLCYSLPAAGVRPALPSFSFSTAVPPVPHDGGLPLVSTAPKPSPLIEPLEKAYAASDTTKEQVSSMAAPGLPVQSAKRNAGPEAFRDLGIPRALTAALSEQFPHVSNPTSAQKVVLRSVLKDGKDVFLKDKTGQGKTFALAIIALSRALKIRSKRLKAAKNPSRWSSRITVSQSPSVLLLLPHATLVRQVGIWVSRLLSAMTVPGLSDGEKESMVKLVLPGDVQSRGSLSAPEVLVSSPDALLSYLQVSSLSERLPNKQHPVPYLTPPSLSRSLRLVMVDEADAMLRPLPGRFKSFTSERERQRHPFFRHPPAIVCLLDDLFGRDGERNGGDRQIQTVWCSATLNSVLRGFVHRSGWIRNQEQVIIDTAQGSEILSVDNHKSDIAIDCQEIEQTAHYCLTVDPLTGSLSNLGTLPAEPSYNELVATSPDDPAGKEKIHPLMVENLALLYASRSSAVPGNNSISLVIVPEGASVPNLQVALQSLGVKSTILDGSHEQDTANLLLVARSHVRGLDVPNVRTVYLLNGLDVTSLSKAARAAGGVEERKREYTHFAGRMGRLGAADRAEASGEKHALVTLVMRDSAEEKAVRAMFGGKVALEVEVMKGEGISI
ncbi:hypothetical protein QFC19_001459 [Naganishia cerealis]|uniref:Uncharacterized protein n=1 Tax=Naganishia cerealis TaxID=610337 RepID=A0ACC2WH24_9TREE|nr:hypothetical protein QFC19_001459 [Naganishia cerealis]